MSVMFIVGQTFSDSGHCQVSDKALTPQANKVGRSTVQLYINAKVFYEEQSDDFVGR